MEISPLKRLTGQEYGLSKTIEYVKEWTDQFAPCPFLVGNNISATILTTDTVINHGLNKTPQGFFIMDKTTNATVWRVSWNDKTITLKASLGCPVKLWVF